jgi:hypothetical protein
LLLHLALLLERRLFLSLFLLILFRSWPEGGRRGIIEGEREASERRASSGVGDRVALLGCRSSFWLPQVRTCAANNRPRRRGRLLGIRVCLVPLSMGGGGLTSALQAVSRASLRDGPQTERLGDWRTGEREPSYPSLRFESSYTLFVSGCRQHGLRSSERALSSQITCVAKDADASAFSSLFSRRRSPGDSLHAHAWCPQGHLPRRNPLPRQFSASRAFLRLCLVRPLILSPLSLDPLVPDSDRL